METQAPARGWRRTLALCAASLFLTWHAAAMVVGPLPASHSAAAIYPVFAPYLRALNQESSWSFFAPDPGAGRLLSYEVELGDGTVERYALTAALARTSPAYLRYTTLFSSLDETVPHQVVAAVDFLCARHADRAPRSVTLVHTEQIVLGPQAYREGHRPLQGDYVQASRLDPVPCGGAS